MFPGKREPYNSASYTLTDIGAMVSAVVVVAVLGALLANIYGWWLAGL